MSYSATIRELNNRIGLMPKIPLYIHQTYKTANLPEVWKESPINWKKHHPKWKYFFWSDDDCRKLVAEKFPSFLSTFDGYEYPIQKADAIRPIILYTYGGVYADMDMMAKRPIDDLFYRDADVYLLTTPNTGITTNCFMASKPKARFWLYVIELMRDHAADPSSLWISKHLMVMNTTGPSLLQLAYSNWVNSSNNKKCHIEFLPRAYLFPEECNVCAPKPCSTCESYITILPGSSWCGNDSYLLTNLYCHYDLILLLLTLGIILATLQAY